MEGPDSERRVIKGKANFWCEWEECSYETESKVDFYEHVKHHIPSLKIATDEDGTETYVCNWLECNYSVPDSKIIVRHVKFHAYHSILKVLGAVYSYERKLPVCAFSEEERNTIPSQEAPLFCAWGKCFEEFTGPMELYNHVYLEHVRDLKREFTCRWTDCKSTASNTNKMAEHIRAHTKEKLIACPNCGQMFANRTKFSDHCHRQILDKEKCYQCSICRSYLPTERLLKDHVRQHVHHYKCSFCDMTCSKPAVLSAHIRYRHLTDTPFKCVMCNYAAKFETDLNDHIKTHDKNRRVACDDEGCSFTAREASTVRRHIRKVHMEQHGYACHLCDKKYTLGFRLTKHLLKVHNVRKPPGYSRFTYRLDDDGYHRLQTTRLESLEVPDYIEMVKKTGDDDKSEDEPESEQPQNEFITIDVMDENGAVILSDSVLVEKTALPPEAKIVAVAN